jgi:hypothetical protein
MNEGRKRTLAVVTAVLLVPRLGNLAWDGRSSTPSCESFLMSALGVAERIMEVIDPRYPLALFGLSIFWRAVAHEWTSRLTRKAKYSIDLGDYLNPIGAYLLGGTCPEGIAIVMTAATDFLSQRYAFMPRSLCMQLNSTPNMPRTSA